MSSDMAESSQPSFHKVFHIPMPWKYMPLPLTIVAVSLCIVWIAAPDEPWFTFAVLAALMLIGLGIGLLLMYQASLEVTDTGITLRNWGYIVSSRWDNLKGYSRRTMGVFTVDVLVLRSPGTQFDPALGTSLRILRWTSLHGGPRGLGMSDPDRVGIPVGLFAEDWRNSELGQIVQRYAPQAYETSVL